MPASPAISVVMAVHDAHRHLAAAIRSVLAQSFRDFELILVDDGGLDRSMDVSGQLGDPRVRVVRHSGLAGARNCGIAAACGAYVALLDGCDLWHPDKLRLHMVHLRLSGVDVSCCGSQLIDAAGDLLGVRQAPWLGRVLPQDVFCGRVIRNRSVPVIRRSLLEAATLPATADGRVQYFDESLRPSEDVECWTRLAFRTQARFGSIDEDLTFHRIGVAGLSADVIRRLESWEAVCGMVAQYAPAFIGRFGRQARARALRSLAGRSLRQRDRGLAWRLAIDAIRAWPQLCLREPRSTLSTLAACLVLRAVPSGVFAALAGIAGSTRPQLARCRRGVAGG